MKVMLIQTHFFIWKRVAGRPLMIFGKKSGESSNSHARPLSMAMIFGD